MQTGVLSAGKMACRKFYKNPVFKKHCPMYNKNTIYGNGYFVSMIKAVKEGDIFGYDRAGTPAGFKASEIVPVYGR